MIWIAIGLLAVAALAPLAVALERSAATRGARDMALALHRTQLSELDRDLAEGRILPAEHATAVLEVQRRLLAVAEKPERDAAMGPRWPVLAAVVLVPAAAFGLYLVGGSPDMPSVTPGSAASRAEHATEEAQLIDQLRERVATLDPHTEQARKGYELLGNVEAARGNDVAAAKAWRTVLQSKFDPILAVRTAEAASRAEGGVSPSSAALLRRALAAAAPGVPWRQAAEDMLKQAAP